jgi:hypothetical protein
VVIVNELLDDLPCRVFFTDADGERYELTPRAREEDASWHLELSATEPPDLPSLAGMPPGTVTATSDESLRLLEGIVGLLDRGGLLLVHDYGFADSFADSTQYADVQIGLPPSVELELPNAPGAPKSFFRVYGNESARAIQLTNDVNFAELAALLEPTGTVITLPHGNLLSTIRTWPNLFFKGDGVFVSEFITLTAEDDLTELLAELHGHQRELRDRYVTTLGNGRSAVFHDLIYIKD